MVAGVDGHGAVFGVKRTVRCNTDCGAGLFEIHSNRSNPPPVFYDPDGWNVDLNCCFYAAGNLHGRFDLEGRSKWVTNVVAEVSWVVGAPTLASVGNEGFGRSIT